MLNILRLIYSGIIVKIKLVSYAFSALLIILIFNWVIPTKVYAQSACTSVSNCAFLRTTPINFNFDADTNTECITQRSDWDCSIPRDDITDCFQDSTTCTEQIGVCNNGVGGTPNDGYTCNNFCTDLAKSPNCGASPGVDCTTYKNTCLNSYCKPAGGGTNYTCPSPQECVSPPDAKAHQCITPVVTVNPPTVTLTVNNAFALTVNKGDQYVLSWTIGGSSSTCTNNWGITNAPTSGPGSGITTDSKQDAGIYVYSLTCSNSAGSDSKGVSVNVRKTCPDYNSCSACVSQNTCGWKGDNNTCQTGTSACPANTNQWYWTDCLTNMCAASAPTPTPTTTTCTGSPTCSTSASATSPTSGRATITKTGGCSQGYDRVEWFLGPSGGTLQSQGSNFGPSADFSNLTTNTTYGVSASWWSTVKNPDNTDKYPSVTCQPPASFTPTSTSTPTSGTTSTNLDCLYCGFGTASGVWVNKGEQSCNSGWNASGGICKDPGYTWACDRWGQTNNPQITVTPDLSISTNPPSRGTACKKPTSTTSGGSTSDTGNIMGRFLLKTPDGYYVIGNLNEQNHPLRSYFISVNPWLNTEYLSQSGFYLGPTSGSKDDGFEQGPYDCGGVCYQWTHNYDTTNAKIYVLRQDDALEVVGAIIYQRYLQYGPPVTKFEVCTGTNDKGQCISYLQYYKTKCFGSAGTPVGVIGVGTKEAQPGNGGTFSLTPWASAPCSSTNGTSCGPAPTSFTSADFAGYKTTGPTSGTICKGDDCNQSYTAVPAYYVALSGANQQNIVQSCVQSATNNVVIDFIFIKKPVLSGLVCKDNNSDGSCITGTGTARTCTDGPYTSGTVTATKTVTGPTTSRLVTPGGGYSMYLPSGNYNVSFAAPNVRVTSPDPLPKLISNLNADTTQDFCVNPTSAWLKTTGGDVHSNTRINTPGGPQ